MKKITKITKSMGNRVTENAVALTESGVFLSFGKQKGTLGLNVETHKALGSNKVDFFMEDESIIIRPAINKEEGYSVAYNGGAYCITLYNMVKNATGECPAGKRFYGEVLGENEVRLTLSKGIGMVKARKASRKDALKPKSRLKTFGAKVIANNDFQPLQKVKALNEASARKKLEAQWGKDVNIKSLYMMGRKKKA